MNKKTIWITGGSTGIGKALAIKFANEGWNVAISARRENLLNEIADNHENINSFPLDVTDKSKCKEVFEKIKNKFENIDICFFSTGTWNPKKERDIDVEQIEEVFKINFFGTLNAIKAVEEYFKKKKIVSNPNCSTIQMVMALKPIHDLFKIKKIIVATYQSTSGAGKSAMDELFHQTLDVYKNKPLVAKNFTKKIAFNLIPHIDEFLDDGSTKEEKKMIEETQKIFKDKFEIFSTCVRVPVFVGHGEAIYLETEKTIDLKKLISNIKKFPGLSLVDKKIDGGYVTPEESAGEDDVFISRLRLGANKKTIGLWVVADNLRKGAALNTVQIAELIIKNKMK